MRNRDQKRHSETGDGKGREGLACKRTIREIRKQRPNDTEESHHGKETSKREDKRFREEKESSQERRGKKIKSKGRSSRKMRNITDPTGGKKRMGKDKTPSGKRGTRKWNYEGVNNKRGEETPKK